MRDPVLLACVLVGLVGTAARLVTPAIAPPWVEAVFALCIALPLGSLAWQLTRGPGRDEALASDLARLALLTRTTSDGIVITDVARRITWVNAGFERLTGYTAAEVIGQSPGSLLQCELTDALTVQRLREALRTSSPIRCEILNRGKNGQHYWLELKIQPLLDQAGVVEGYMARQVNIDERKRAEAALHASQTLLDRTGQIGGVGGWEVDLATRRVRWTDQTCRMLGRDPGFEPSLRDCLDHCTPEALLVIETTIAEGLSTQSSWDHELTLVTRQGEPILVRIAAQCEFSDRGPVRIVGALQDITALREMQDDNRRNTELLTAAIETIDEAFVLYDPQDRLVYCNEKFRDMHATSRDLLVPGTPFEQIIRVGAQRGQFPAALDNQEEWVERRLIAHREGNRTLVQQLDNGRIVRAVDRLMADGHIVGFRVDITDLVRATEAAEHADRAKSEFIATMSHELRTPLQSITGFSDLGRVFAKGHPQFEPMFEDIHAGGMRMLKLVNELLDISKIDSAQGSLQLRDGDLAELAREVLRELAPLTHARQLVLDGPAADTTLPVGVDAFRMQQVLRNVLANAIRFAPNGSTIHIDGRNLGREGVELSVRDHGPGIPAEELEQVFEAFVQSSRTRDGSGGTGLGLAISRKIMSAHGGRITASLPTDGGALLRLWLPARAERAQSTPAGGAGEARPRSLRAVHERQVRQIATAPSAVHEPVV